MNSLFLGDKTLLVSEISSNHNGDLVRCKEMIDASFEAGCDGVKFQLFKINELFSPEAIAFKPELLDRIKWELDENLIPELSEYTKSKGLLFSCTPFYLEAVDVLSPYVDFFKIASYELLWKDLFVKCASTNLPLVFSIGMSNEDEVVKVLDTLKSTNVNEIIILHCNSSYPTPIQDVNLSVIYTLRNRFSNYYDNKKLYFGWSDHTVNEDVMIAAVLKYNSKMLEFHIDLDGSGYEFKAGHCWLPSQIRQLRDKLDYFTLIDGNSKISPSNSESIERSWRADPGDGLRPLLETRKKLILMNFKIAIRTDGSNLLGNGHIIRMLALSHELNSRKIENIFFIKHDEFWINKLQSLGRDIISVDSSEIDFFLKLLVSSNITHLVYDTRNDLSSLELKYLKSNSNIKFIIVDSPEDIRIHGDLNLYPPIPQIALWNWDRFEGKILSGWEYVFLRREFSLDLNKKEINKTKNILLSFGSTDPYRITEKVILLLEGSSEWKKDYNFQIILGPQFDRIAELNKIIRNSELNFELIIAPDDIVKLFLQVEFAIISFGVTAYELASLSVPAFYITISEDHTLSATAFVKEKLGILLGEFNNLGSNLDEEIKSYLESREKLLNITTKITNWDKIINAIVDL